MTSNSVSKLKYDYDGIEDAFPEVDPGAKPFGSKVLVQIRSAKETTAGGIVLPHETQETELWNTQVAKVIGIGPVAFRNRDTLEPWPEGDWVEPGMFIRVPKYGGDRWEIQLKDKEGKFTHKKAIFMIIKDLECIGEITCNPLEVVAFI